LHQVKGLAFAQDSLYVGFRHADLNASDSGAGERVELRDPPRSEQARQQQNYTHPDRPPDPPPAHG
jgi:hypothetical protein